MTFGEKLLELRKQKGLSQEALASQLTVSRQAVSRWEMGSSMPDTENVIQLSKLFSVSTDYLLNDGLGNDADIQENKFETDEEISQESGKECSHTFRTQKVIGIIIIAVGLFTGAFALILTHQIPIVPVLYMLLCGTLCIVVKKHAVLIIGWITVLPICLTLPYYTSTRLLAVFDRTFYQHGKYIQIIMAFIIWIVLILLAFFTCKAIYKKYCSKNKSQ